MLNDVQSEMIPLLNVLELARFTTPTYPCPYLAEPIASLTYRILVEVRPADYDELLQRGWRRFGYEFFRPACPACAECRSLRLRLQDFKPSRSQRRVLKANSDVQIVVQAPTATVDHVRLYNAYHEDMSERKNWSRQTHNIASYYENFVAGEWEFAREFQYRVNGRLIGVALADVTSQALSSIYFYHDPDWRPKGPGVFSILQQNLHAQQLGLTYQYLGYWVAQSHSMAYKSQYRPHEILIHYPADTETPVWLGPED